jgi:hypothetical protein
MPGCNRRWLREVSHLFGLPIEKQPGQLHTREESSGRKQEGCRKEGVGRKGQMKGGCGQAA